MPKVTPNPPDTDPTSFSANFDPEKPEETSDRIPSYADIRATPRRPCTMYVIDPQIDVETLLGNAC